MWSLLASCTVLAQSHPVLGWTKIGFKTAQRRYSEKVTTWRQIIEVDRDARSDKETVAKGTQDGRFTENLTTTCSASVYLLCKWT